MTSRIITIYAILSSCFPHTVLNSLTSTKISTIPSIFLNNPAKLCVFFGLRVMKLFPRKRCLTLSKHQVNMTTDEMDVQKTLENISVSSFVDAVISMCPCHNILRQNNLIFF